MSERKQRRESQKRTGLGFVLMLLLSSLGALAISPTASAAVSGSLGITTSSSPVPDGWYASLDAVEFTAEVTNHYLSPSGATRTLTWYACSGQVTEATCKSTFAATGSFAMQNIAGNTTMTVPSTGQWVPGGNANGIYTILYTFSNNDQDPTDDALLFHINLTTNYVDAVIEKDHNPLEHLENLSTYDNELVLNTGTDYVLKSKGEATICNVCSFTGEFGWQLWDLDETMLLKEAYRSVSNLPAWGGPSPFNMILPDFSFNQEGRFLLKHGLFNSTGNPHSDLNQNNNLATYELVLNDSIDLKITNVYPSHSAESGSFYYGTDRVVAEIANLGNTTVASITASFQVYDQQYELEVSDSCDIDVMHPGATVACSFNMTTTGASRLLRVQLPTIYANGEDSRMGDNLYSLTTNVEVGPINANIQINSDNKVFLSTEHVELVGRFSEIASQPLNYTWREGFYTWGYGQVLNLTGETFGLGPHNISVQIQDPWGNTDYAYVEFDVLNSVNISNEPYWTGSATTDQAVTFSHDVVLPHLGVPYFIGQGKSPLLLIDLALDGINSEDNGLRTMDLDLNLSALLPDNIDPSTVELRYLPSTESQLWNYLDGVDTYTYDPIAERISATLTMDGVLLVIGVLPETNVTAMDFAWTQLKEGQIQLDWNAQGDITNPYVGGWKMFKIQGITGTTVFPDPAAGVSDAIWEELTMDSHVATLDLADTQWIDPNFLETGICASYAIAPIDREGMPNYQMINITRVNGQAGLLCGDAVPPSTTVEQFNHVWTFTNSTECFDLRKDWSTCYEVSLSWTWPDHEPQGNLSWNLYRIEYAPDNVNLKFVEPIAEGLTGIPGESGTFTQDGLETDGIRPYRTYYYILAPIDSVGNELLLANYPSPNIERVHIDDDWWSYNQHVIPPEPEPPEPPLGIPWLQKLNDATQVSEFKLAGMVMLATILLNFILLPLILKKRKRLKRVMEARKRNMAASTEFDDFFE